MNADILKGKIRENGMTQDNLAKGIGISLSRLNAKINGKDGAEFTLGEAQAIRNLLRLSMDQMESIFFT